MALANQEAIDCGHPFIDTEHILLGLVKEDSGVAANVLKNLVYDIRKVRSEVEKLMPAKGETDERHNLPQTDDAKAVIQYAIEEARLLRHNYVGTEHVLLGLMRESKGVAAQAMTNLGLGIEQVRREIMVLLTGEG
jgi:ATP-dependent Clp protease ATP-binding subunit ClpC